MATAVSASTLLLVSGMNELVRFFALDTVRADYRITALWILDLERFTTRNSGFFAPGCSMLLWGRAATKTPLIPRGLGVLMMLAGILGILIIPFQPLGIIATALKRLVLSQLERAPLQVELACTDAHLCLHTQAPESPARSADQLPFPIWRAPILVIESPMFVRRFHNGKLAAERFGRQPGQPWD